MPNVSGRAMLPDSTVYMLKIEVCIYVNPGFSVSLKKGRFYPCFLQMSPKFPFLRDIDVPLKFTFFC